MRTSHLSRLLVDGGELRDLALLHAQWAIGVGRFDDLRGARLAAGMPEHLGADDIVGDTLKVSLPEADGTTRTSVVRLSAHPDGVLVEHLVVRQGDAHRLRTPSAESPEIVRHLLADRRVAPDELLPATFARVGEADVVELVARVRGPQRRIPLVLVSVDNATREPVVDPAELARRLAGMVAVHFLVSARVSHRLRDELVDNGFSDKFGCYNGGVRIVWPGVVAGDDPYQHLLLLPVRLLTIPDRVRTEQVAGLLCEMIAEGEDPRAWLRDVDMPTRPEPRPVPPSSSPAPQAAAVQRRPAPSTATTSPPPLVDPPSVEAPAAVLASSDEPTRSEAPVELRVVEGGTPSEPAPASPTPGEPSSSRARPSSTWSKLADDMLAAFDLAAELERDLEATRRDLVESRQALRRAEQERDELAEAAKEFTDVAEAVKLAEVRFADRLVVLPSAHASAIDSAFRDPERCFRVLALLAMFGQHDSALGEALIKALGHAAEWKPKDSPATTSKFGAQRTWTDHEGRRRLYSRHVTLGGSVNPTRCLQLYYDVLPDGRIELAWVGEHRPTVGKDT